MIENLMTNNFKTLCVLYKYQIILPNGTKYTPLSQVDIAQILNVSTITMNSIFKYLKKNNLVIPFENKRGTYCLTDKALIILDGINDIENKIKEVK